MLVHYNHLAWYFLFKTHRTFFFQSTTRKILRIQFWLKQADLFQGVVAHFCEVGKALLSCGHFFVFRPGEHYLVKLFFCVVGVCGKDRCLVARKGNIRERERT